jgi:hypothetical protein
MAIFVLSFTFVYVRPFSVVPRGGMAKSALPRGSA